MKSNRSNALADGANDTLFTGLNRVYARFLDGEISEREFSNLLDLQIELANFF